MPPLAAERRRKLLKLLTERGAVNVGDAERELGVSRMTVHRDLDALAAEGLLRKVHGGAVALPGKRRSATAAIPPFSERRGVAKRAKRALANHLADLLAGAHTVALDAGTTTFHLAEAWAERGVAEDLFIATCGLELFNELRRQTKVRAALIGGEPHPRTGSLTGPLAEAGAAALRFDFTVVSALGVMPKEGLVLDALPEETAVKRALLASGRRKILAVDSSKLGISAPYELCSLDEFDLLVDENGPRKITELLSEKPADNKEG